MGTTSSQVTAPGDNNPSEQAHANMTGPRPHTHVRRPTATTPPTNAQPTDRSAASVMRMAQRAVDRDVDTVEHNEERPRKRRKMVARKSATRLMPAVLPLELRSATASDADDGLRSNATRSTKDDESLASLPVSQTSSSTSILVAGSAPTSPEHYKFRSFAFRPLDTATNDVDEPAAEIEPDLPTTPTKQQSAGEACDHAQKRRLSPDSPAPSDGTATRRSTASVIVEEAQSHVERPVFTGFTQLGDPDTHEEPQPHSSPQVTRSSAAHDTSRRPGKLIRPSRPTLSHTQPDPIEDFNTNDTHDNQRSVDSVSQPSSPPSPKYSSRKQKASVLETEEVASDVENVPESDPEPATGKFTDKERRIVASIFEQSYRAAALPRAEFVENIQKWSCAANDDFKSRVESALSRRSKASIRKFCKRAYHNYEVGAWTEEQDKLLRESMAMHKEQWTQIALDVGRRAEDCRDRWRNVLSVANAVSGPWSVVDEEALQSIVEDQLAVAQKIQAVNWNVVASKLGSTRSAKNCREKYALLAKRQDGNVDFSKLGDKKQKWAASQIELFKIGDHYDVLREIEHAFPDSSKHYEHETTFWAVVAQRNPGSRFPSAVRKVSFERCKAFVNVSDASTSGPLAEAAIAMARTIEEIHGLPKLDAKRRYNGINSHFPSHTPT